MYVEIRLACDMLRQQVTHWNSNRKQASELPNRQQTCISSTATTEPACSFTSSQSCSFLWTEEVSTIYYKVQVTLSLFMLCRHTWWVQLYRHLIIDLGTGWRWMVTLTPWPPYPWEKSSWYQLGQTRYFGEEKNLLPLCGFEPQIA
jgi:hypothetical protein